MPPSVRHSQFSRTKGELNAGFCAHDYKNNIDLERESSLKTTNARHLAAITGLSMGGMKRLAIS